jgi:putative flippase GtrA
VVGGVAALANFGSRFVFNRWVSFEIAVLLAYCVGMAFAFVLMRSFVFAGHSRGLHVQVRDFVAVNCLAVAQTLLVSVVLARRVLPAIGVHDYAESLAHAIGIAVPIVTSFFAHRNLTFR